MDSKTRLMYRAVAWGSGLIGLAIMVYGLLTSLVTTGGVVQIGETLVSVEVPFPPYFAKPVSYFAVAAVAFFYSSLRLWEERIASWPPVVLSFVQLFGFVVAFSSAYEVLYNFMLWGAIFSVEFLKNVTNPNFIATPIGIPWNLVFATHTFSALFVISGYSVYFIRRLNREAAI